MPQRAAVRGIERDQLAGVAGKEKMAGGGQDAAADAAAGCFAAVLVLPADSAGAYIHREQRGPRIEIAAASTAVAFGLIGGVVEVRHAVAFRTVQVEELGLRIVAG